MGNRADMGFVVECAADISYASIRPGVMRILHSSGCMLCHDPFSAQKKIDAMVLVALVG